MNAIEEVAKAANEGADGTSNIAMKVANINNMSEEVLNEVQQTKEASDVLKSEIAKFTV